MSADHHNPAAWHSCSAVAPTADAVRFDASWRTSTVLAIAAGIVRDGNFDAMPILADALEDAGCDNSILLDHCRNLASHEPNCWVLPLILTGAAPTAAPSIAQPSVVVAAAQMLRQRRPRLVREMVREMIPCILLSLVPALVLLLFDPQDWGPELLLGSIGAVVCVALVFLLLISLLVYGGMCCEVIRERRSRSVGSSDAGPESETPPH